MYFIRISTSFTFYEDSLRGQNCKIVFLFCSHFVLRVISTSYTVFVTNKMNYNEMNKNSKNMKHLLKTDKKMKHSFLINAIHQLTILAFFSLLERLCGTSFF